MVKGNNIAFIDGQNFYLGTARCANPWEVSLKKFRIFLKDRYKVVAAYYYLGFRNADNKDLYKEIKDAGFELNFREHNKGMATLKKGNVDSDIIFSVMEKIYYQEKFDKIILVSGDGDYKRMIDFLIKEKRMNKILFPNRDFASSLYKKLGSEFYDYLDGPSIKKKIIK
ncbi:MAG: NYN domain protein [Parcubacteria group bacterium ADurb.Bin216]|nr:MAG: NYN domain protein [Parcubacteria group bacterium ADurb.Bin216]